MKKRILYSVLEVFNQPDIHPTAADLFLVAKEAIEGLDESIFYEALDELEQQGRIRSIVHPHDMQKRFHLGQEYHCHFICNQCGKVKDVILEQGAVSMIHNHVQTIISSYALLDKVNLSFQGKCHECREN